MYNPPSTDETHRPPNRATLSVTVITLNEERNLSRCLKSVEGLADQIVVVDSESSDATREIAEAAGAKVFVQKFLGYGSQKQFALEKATGDWVLSLDADEWLDREARRAVRRVLESPTRPEINGFRLRMRLFYLGKWIEHGGVGAEWKLRLVRRGFARFGEAVIHESLSLTEGKSERLPGRICHLSFPDLTFQIAKLNRYTEIIAKRDEHTPLPRIWFGMLLEPPLVFLHKYIIQLGILDGLRGLLLSAMTAFYFFLRYGKIWQRRMGKHTRLPPDDSP